MFVVGIVIMVLKHTLACLGTCGQAPPNFQQSPEVVDVEALKGLLYHEGVDQVYVLRWYLEPMRCQL